MFSPFIFIMSEIEEEFYVYAELDDTVNVESYRTIHVLGIDSKKPVVQMDDNFFNGKFSHPLGTYLFFEEDVKPDTNDALFDKIPEKNLKYLCKTNKVMKVERTHVTFKDGKGEQEVLNKLKQPQDKVNAVKFHSVKEAIEKFKCEWRPTDVPELNSNTVEELENEFPQQN